LTSVLIATPASGTRCDKIDPIQLASMALTL
jgi:hypothetical protein